MSIGFLLPFQQSTGSLGFFATSDDLATAAAQNVRSLLVTNRGDRPMRFNMGCSLRDFLFEQLAPGELKQSIADRIEEQFSRWLPYLRIDELFILTHDDDPALPENALKVKIRYRFVDRPSLSSVVETTITS
jgi:phage baseplate assembly protein W